MWLGILVAAVAAQVVGGIWYGKFFREDWMRLAGLTADDMKDMPLTANQSYAVNFVLSLIMAFGISFILRGLEAASAGSAMMIAFLLWISFFVPLTAGATLWEGKPFRLVLLNASQWLVSLEVMSLIIYWL